MKSKIISGRLVFLRLNARPILSVFKVVHTGDLSIVSPLGARQATCGAGGTPKKEEKKRLFEPSRIYKVGRMTM
jgi:hypothetical protein